MRKTFIASAIGLALASASSVQAQTITITELRIGGPFGATGTMNSNGNGSMLSTETLSQHHWIADQQNWFDTHSSTLTWSGTGTSANASNAYGDFTYTFHLESNQVAAGIYFDWNGENNVPILTVYDCPVTGGGACIGRSLGMVGGPDPGSRVNFAGTTADDFPLSGTVPVPGAFWLLGSGLLGLIGIARRKKFYD